MNTNSGLNQKDTLIIDENELYIHKPEFFKYLKDKGYKFETSDFPVSDNFETYKEFYTFPSAVYVLDENGNVRPPNLQNHYTSPVKACQTDISVTSTIGELKSLILTGKTLNRIYGQNGNKTREFLGEKSVLYVPAELAMRGEIARLILLFTNKLSFMICVENNYVLKNKVYYIIKNILKKDVEMEDFNITGTSVIEIDEFLSSNPNLSEADKKELNVLKAFLELSSYEKGDINLKTEESKLSILNKIRLLLPFVEENKMEQLTKDSFEAYKQSGGYAYAVDRGNIDDITKYWNQSFEVSLEEIQNHEKFKPSNLSAQFEEFNRQLSENTSITLNIDSTSLAISRFDTSQENEDSKSNQSLLKRIAQKNALKTVDAIEYE
jgi:hypothetical protein